MHLGTDLAQISEISRSLYVALFLEVMPRLSKWENSFHAKTRAKLQRATFIAQDKTVWQHLTGDCYNSRESRES